MKAAIIGYGKMGCEVEKILEERGHEIICRIDTSEELSNANCPEAIAIDFSTPESFSQNYRIIADKFKGAVIGTTGWNSIEGEVKYYFKEKNKSLVYGSNFSIGVNIFFNALDYLTEMLSQTGEYEPFIIEKHHKEKKDAPSGTAITISEILKKYFKKEILPLSVRSGFIKGEHEVTFESEADKIILKHEAYSRKGFALGAVAAAEWLSESGGIWSFRDMLNEKLKNEK